MFFESEVHIGELLGGGIGRAIDRGLYGCMKGSLCRELSEDGLKLLRRDDGEITQIL